MDHEMEKFQKELLASVRQMKAGKAVRTTEVKLPAAAEARAKGGVSKSASKGTTSTPSERSN